MTKTNIYKGPLVGLNVIDFGHYYAGPMAAMLLADQGANVIRIARPGEPELPSQQYRLLNRNKKLLILDLKTPAGKAQALSLIERADVLIENFRPGVMKRLGLDYTSVTAHNPRLVYLSLPGFASTDKERAHIQAWEGILGAAAGLYMEANIFREPLGYPPLYTSVPICSSYGAAHGAVAVVAALLAHTGQQQGTLLEVPLVDAGMASCTDRHILSILGGPFQQPSWLRAVSGSAAQVPEMMTPFTYSPEDSPEAQLKKLAAGWSGYLSSDGRKMLFALAKPWHVERFYKVLGIYDSLMSEGLVNRGGYDTSDNNLSAIYPYALSPEPAQKVAQITSEILKTKKAEEWEAIMAEIGVPFSMTRTRDEWLILEPLLGSGLLTRMDNGQSILTVPGRIADISGPGGALIGTCPQEPAFIEYNDAEALFQPCAKKETNQRARSPVKKGDLLKGLKVLDLCSIVAGPNASYVLAQYGAEVIRVEPPQTFNLPVHLVCCLEVNQGKRSVLLDTKTAPGQKAFQKLVSWADVVVHNRVDDIATRLGLTLAQLQKINPNVVVCQITALGGTYRGFWEGRLGFDNTANMPSGLYAHFGSLDSPMSFGGVSADLMAGVGTAFSALLGIYQLRETGYAGEGRSSLARATNQNQFPWMIAEHGNSDWGEARGQFTVGLYWWQRMYQCRDGWIYVGTSEARASVLSEAVTEQRNADEKTLELAFAEQNCSYWMNKLQAVDVACQHVLSLDDIHADARVRRVGNEAADETINGELESLRWDAHPCGLPVILPSPSWVRVGETQTYRRLTPAPRVGAHTREVLAEFGYTENEIDELVQLRVVHEYLPVLGNKSAYFFQPEKR